MEYSRNSAKENIHMRCYAAYARDMDIRMSGSSGGLFPVLSQHHIKKGGIVYGAVYSDDFNVVFQRIDSMDELTKTFTSKYVQSRMNNIAAQVAHDLNAGRSVMFCATPCQVAGLHKYLSLRRVNTENLITLDFICHGVPSEDVFHRFMSRYSEPSCISLNMRNKEKGWNWGGFSWEFCFEDGRKEIVNQGKVPYMKGFLSNLYLRPSCYACKVKQQSAADITLGDFWGITDVLPNVDAASGVSCIIERTPKGSKCLSHIMDEIELFDVTYSDILKGNICLEHSAKRPIARNKIFHRLSKTHDFDGLILSLSRRGYKSRIANKIYSKVPHRGTSIRDLTNKNHRVFYKKKEQCCGCASCYTICPISAIELKKDDEGFFYPIIDSTKCTGCRLCEKVCPFQ